MPLGTRLASGFLSLTVLAGAVAGTVEQSAARDLSHGEIAAIAGVGGFVLGLGIANANRGPDHYGDHRSPWERHVDRCYARYLTYDHRADTFIGNDGFEHRCRL